MPPLPIRRDEALREGIETCLNRFEVRRHEDDVQTHRAAVALAVIDEGHGAALAGIPTPPAWSDRAAMLLTRRAATLRRHASQWALPGGRIDAGESAEDAALRELEEEVGLRLPASRVLGRLDDFTTRSGFSITPIVVWAGEAKDLTPNPAEVESIHRIPLEEFLRADAPMLEVRPEHAHPVLRMPVGTTWIAAPTAALLYQFRELCLLGRETRVDHFEQPSFAWR